jgi:(p)ppGpp synthase/HD superfamily hydrolase
MAKDKKSFILYVDQKDLFNKLPDEIAGKLIKHIYSYVSDENPESEDLIVNIAFEPIKQQLKRDLKLFEEKRIKRSEAGLAGANKRWQEMANDSKRINDIAKIADNDNDNDNVISKDIYRSFAHLSITNSDVEKLLEKYSINEIDDVLDSIENFKGNKKYTSLYLTANKWLSKNKKSTEVEEPKELLLARKLGLC